MTTNTALRHYILPLLNSGRLPMHFKFYSCSCIQSSRSSGFWTSSRVQHTIGERFHFAGRVCFTANFNIITYFRRHSVYFPLLQIKIGFCIAGGHTVFFSGKLRQEVRSHALNCKLQAMKKANWVNLPKRSVTSSKPLRLQCYQYTCCFMLLQDDLC